MVLKLYGVAQSTCTQRVVAVLAEKGITDYELVPVDMSKGAQKQEPHISRQPFGKIPALEDDGFIVFESRAICKYLAVKYQDQGTPLVPKFGDVKAYGIFEQVCNRCLRAQMTEANMH
jgi:glutathione S-transferase